MSNKSQSKFMIEPWEVEALMKSHNLSNPTDLLPLLVPTDLLPLLVPTARLLARPQISNFHVGAAGLGSSGRVYLGCNLEFPGLPLHHSVHAEQFLLANASLHSEPSLLSLAVSHAPCGHCRQFLQEIRHSHQLKILVTSDQEPLFRPLLDFLPRPFGPSDLLASDSLFLLEKNFENGNCNSKVCCNGSGGDLEGVVVRAAEEAVERAHAPYSGCRSGFAVADGEGRVFKGWYMESAAYNPSLGPVQAAMVGYLVGGGEEWEGIVGGALVEEEGAMVEQEGTVRVFFGKVAPRAKIWVKKFKRGEGVEM